MDDVQVAPPDTVLGQLQRGRGSGARAVEHDPNSAVDLVAHCVANDPRWDHQVEERDLYYARLMLDHGWPVHQAEAHLFSAADFEGQDEWRTGLTIHVLALLADAGRADALAVLRRYAVEGWNWRWALDSLAGLDDPAATAGLDEPILSRLDDAELARAVDTDRIWREWAEIHPRVRAAMSELGDTRDRWQRANADPDWTAMARDELIASVRSRSGNPRLAAVELGRRVDRVLFELAEEVLPHPGGARAGVIRSLLRWPTDDVLPLARHWCAERTDCRHDGVRILSERGSGYDAHYLLDYLQECLDEGAWSAMCSAIDGVGRLQTRAAEPHLLRIWEATQYSYGRRCAFDALRNLGSDALEEIATEGLWDCESDVRLGAIATGPSSVITRGRIARLAADQLEDDSVRAAAQARRSQP